MKMIKPSVEFCKEYVQLIAAKTEAKECTKTLTTCQLKTIVLEGKSVDVELMFPDGGVKDLASARLNPLGEVGAEVYKFVRDNQHLFVKEV